MAPADGLPAGALEAALEVLLERTLARIPTSVRLERATAALRKQGYAVVPDEAGYLRVRRARRAHV